MDIQSTYGEKPDLMLRVHCPLDCLVEGNLVPAKSSNTTIITAEIKDGIGLNWVPVADMVSYQSSQVGLRPLSMELFTHNHRPDGIGRGIQQASGKAIGLGGTKKKMPTCFIQSDFLYIVYNKISLNCER